MRATIAGARVPQADAHTHHPPRRPRWPGCAAFHATNRFFFTRTATGRNRTAYSPRRTTSVFGALDSRPRIRAAWCWLRANAPRCGRSWRCSGGAPAPIARRSRRTWSRTAPPTLLSPPLSPRDRTCWATETGIGKIPIAGASARPPSPSCCGIAGRYPPAAPQIPGTIPAAYFATAAATAPSASPPCPNRPIADVSADAAPLPRTPTAGSPAAVWRKDVCATRWRCRWDPGGLGTTPAARTTAAPCSRPWAPCTTAASSPETQSRPRNSAFAPLAIPVVTAASYWMLDGAPPLALVGRPAGAPAHRPPRAPLSAKSPRVATARCTPPRTRWKSTAPATTVK
eukprot:ctg_923.g407